MNEMFAAISGSAMIQALLWLVAAACVYLVLDWGRKTIAPPEPINKIAQVIIVLIVVFMVLNAIFLALGKPIVAWP